MDLLKGIAGLVIAYLLLKALFRGIRHYRLMQKYGDTETVRRIMNKTIWEGMTTEQLVDCLGKPVDIDERFSKKSVTRTYKYRRTGRGRYGTRVKVRDNQVIEWDVK